MVRFSTSTQEKSILKLHTCKTISGAWDLFAQRSSMSSMEQVQSPKIITLKSTEKLPFTRHLIISLVIHGNSIQRALRFSFLKKEKKDQPQILNVLILMLILDQEKIHVCGSTSFPSQTILKKIYLILGTLICKMVRLFISTLEERFLKAYIDLPGAWEVCANRSSISSMEQVQSPKNIALKSTENLTFIHHLIISLELHGNSIHIMVRLHRSFSEKDKKDQP